MSLKRHACRLSTRLNMSDGHIWISEATLDNVIQRFSHAKIPRRHVGLAPGPLEARKRAAKRRMVNLARVETGSGFDPSLIPGFGVTPESGWQWQSPTTYSPREEKGIFAHIDPLTRRSSNNI